MMFFCTRCGMAGNAETADEYMVKHAEISPACAEFAAVGVDHVQMNVPSGGYELRCPIVGCTWRNSGTPQMLESDRVHAKAPAQPMHYSDEQRRQLFEAHIEWHHVNRTFGALPRKAQGPSAIGEPDELERVGARLIVLLQSRGHTSLAQGIEALLRGAL